MAVDCEIVADDPDLDHCVLLRCSCGWVGRTSDEETSRALHLIAMNIAEDVLRRPSTLPPHDEG